MENNLISFESMRDQIVGTLSVFIEGNSLEAIELPGINFVKGGSTIEFPVPSISGEMVSSYLLLIKRYINYVRVHSFEQGYFAFQALNENLFKTDNLLDNLKVEFFSLSTSARVEISKKGNLSQDEINLVVAIFKFAYNYQSESPVSRLTKLGASIIKTDPAINWDYMAGYEDVKKKIRESVILPLKNPDIYDSIAKLTRRVFESNRPKAILFDGSPGVGKTTAAKIIATEVNVPLIYVPVESIMSKWYGQSSKNLSDIFDVCDSMNGAIIFLDEIDSLVGSRDTNMFEATRRILSVLLRKIDGMESVGNTLTIGATNRKQDLDHALLSRFDQNINFPLPNASERKGIFYNYAQHLDDQGLTQLGERSEGVSGRNIKDICELVERRWVRKILIQKLEHTPPTLEYYLHTLKMWKSER